MRKTLKILHTVAACGLIGGLAGYMILLFAAPQGTPEAYADLRQSIAAVSNYLLLPSLAIGVMSGLLAMMVHRPFIDMRWVWLKAAMGILMFKGVLTIVGAKADHTAVVSREIANGAVAADVLDGAIVLEWWTLAIVMALSLANVVIGIWRPKLMGRQAYKQTATSNVSEISKAPEPDAATVTPESTRPAA